MEQEAKLLIISPTLPVSDRSAGEYRIFHIAKTLTARYRVYLLPLIPVNDNAHLNLNKNGINIVFQKTSLQNLIREEKFKIVIYERCNNSVDYNRIVKKYNSEKVIVDAHNLGFIEDEKMLDIFPEASKPGKMDNELEIYRRADTVITVTQREKNILEKYINVPVESVSTGTEIPSEIRDRKGRKNILYVGYMQNLQNEDAVLYFVNEIFPLVKCKLPEVKFYIVGSSPTEKVQSLVSDDIFVTGYVRDVSLYYSSFAVSVAPIRIGAGMKSKIIESMAWGCPVVSTSTGAEGMGLLDEQEILISDKPEEFADKVVDIYRNGKKWKNFSENGYEKVYEEYSIQNMARRLLKVV